MTSSLIRAGRCRARWDWRPRPAHFGFVPHRGSQSATAGVVGTRVAALKGRRMAHVPIESASRRVTGRLPSGTW